MQSRRNSDIRSSLQPTSRPGPTGPFRTLAPVLVAASLSTPAMPRTLEVLEYTSELRMSNVIFPLSTAGTVIFKSCPSCDSYTLRVTADTKYIGFDGPLTLAEFRTAVADVQQTDTGEYTTAVTVTYNIETEFVTSIGIHRNAYQWPEIAD